MDGVITLTSPDYWVGTRVLIKMLRHTGCKLPVEVWYQGEKPVISDCELRKLTPGEPIYSLHVRAMLDSQFSRLFYMGSDVYPVVDITPMFNDLQYPGAIFWREQPNGGRFDHLVYGLPECTQRTTWNVQGDTKLIDITKCRDAVQTVYDFCMDPKCQPGNFGDQSHFRAAWAVHRLPQVSYSTNCIDWTSYPFIYLHQSRDGCSVGLVHRVGSKWAGKNPTVFAKPMTFHRTLPLEEVAFKYYADSLNAE